MGSVVNLAQVRALGVAFRRMLTGGSNRNYYGVFGYKGQLTYEDKYLKYLRQDVAARIVDAPAAALWTNPPIVTSNNDEWNQRWDDLVARFNLFSTLERVDKLAGIGRYSILLLGFNDGADLSQPVNTRSLSQKQKDSILFLQPYSEYTAEVIKYNDDQRSEEYCKPEMYRINPLSEFILGFDKSIKKPSGGGIPGSFDVHASRVVHIAENTLENTIFGSPRIERVFNILDDLLKVTGGSAETYWLTANRGLHIDIDKDMEVDPSDAKNLADEIDEYTNELTRVIRTRGTKVTAIGAERTDPTGVFKMLISILSGATGIPSRILIGSEAGQLASDQDRANWADRVDERRASFGNTTMLFSTIKKFVRAGYLTSEPDLQVTVTWPSAFKLSPLEQAQTSAQHARSATNFAKTFETMEKLKRGEPGSPGAMDPEGNPLPGTEKPAIPGVDLGDLVTIDEARKFMTLDKPPVTFNSGEDLGGSSKSRPRVNITVSLGQIMRF